MSDVPKVPDKNWHTELTGEVQPVSDRDQRRSRQQARREQEKDKQEDRVILSGEEPAGAKPDRQHEAPAEDTPEKQRCDDEPGRIIDLEA